MATRGYASLTGERQLNTLLNANPKNLSKDIKFLYLFFFFLISLQTTFCCQQKRPSWATFWQLKLWHSALWVRPRATLLCPSLPQVPAPASFCLVARSIISLGICLFHPFPPPPPPSRNLIPSWQAEGQKSLKAAASTTYTRVLPLHVLPNANVLFSLLHNILYLYNVQVVTWILPSHLLPSPSSAAELSFISNILPCLSQRLSTSCHLSGDRQPLQSWWLWGLPPSGVSRGLEQAQGIWGKESWQHHETHTIVSLKSGPHSANDCKLVWQKRQRTESHPTWRGDSFISLYILKGHIQGYFRTVF